MTLDRWREQTKADQLGWLDLTLSEPRGPTRLKVMESYDAGFDEGWRKALAMLRLYHII
jgi:hypothetical protein